MTGRRIVSSPGRPRPGLHRAVHAVTPVIAAPALSSVRALARDSRGAASIELALGAAVLISVSALCFDLYSRVKADTAVARMAVVMADYVSRDTKPDGDEMKALGSFLHEHELGVPADVVFMVSAIHQPAGDPQPAVKLLWSDDAVRIGDSETTEKIAGKCTRRVEGDPKRPKLPADFTPMREDEVVIVAEVCARLTREGSLTGRFAGDVYRLHALPAREAGQVPAAPAYS